MGLGKFTSEADKVEVARALANAIDERVRKPVLSARHPSGSGLDQGSDAGVQGKRAGKGFSALALRWPILLSTPFLVFDIDGA